jgi:hypothetical protein
LRIFKSKQWEVMGGSSVIRMNKSRRMRWAVNAAQIGEMMKTYMLLVGKPD